MTDVVPDTDEEPADSSVEAGAARRTSRRLAVVLAGALAAVLALSLVLASVAGDRSDLRDEADERRAVAQRASELAVAVSEFDHSDIDASRDAVAALATDGFLTEYEDALSGELRSRLLENEVVIEPTVVDVLVGSVGAAQASAVVELDLRYATKDGPFDVTGNFLQLDLVRTPDGWLVEAVTNLRSGVDSRLSDLLGEDAQGTPAPEGDEPG